jgi:lipopolysaccharide transport system permease protein
MSTRIRKQSLRPSAAPYSVIEPDRGRILPYLQDLWNHRELLYFLVWRDIKVRYKQTVLGAAWAIVQPLMTTLVFSVFLGNLGNIPSNGLPYPLFIFTALLPWQFFALTLADSCNSLVNNQHLITKIYFPRLIIPLSTVCARLLDFGISSFVLVGMLVYYRVMPTHAILLLPLFLLLVIATALAAGVWLASLNVRYRDVGYTIPFLTQFWLFATPVVYPGTLVPEAWRRLYALNPMVGVIEGFRWSLLGPIGPPVPSALFAVPIVALTLISGLLYFRSIEDTFADVI